MSLHEPVVGFQDFTSNGVIVKVFIWVLPAQAFTARTALVLDIKQHLDAAGIEIPYPHQIALNK